MTIPSWVDEYAEMSNPGARVKAWNEIRDSVLDRLGTPDDQELERLIGEWAAMNKARKDAYLAKLNQDILTVHGITLSDLEAMIADRAAKKKGGAKRVNIAPYRTQVFQSFIESEKQGATFSEAIGSAQMVVGTRVTDRSIRDWLKILIKLGLNSTKPPTRRKK